MELNRNQYFLAGLVIFFLGIQLRMVDGFVLNERATHFLHQRMQQMNGAQIASATENATPTRAAMSLPRSAHSVLMAIFHMALKFKSSREPHR